VVSWLGGRSVLARRGACCPKVDAKCQMPGDGEVGEVVLMWYLGLEAAASWHEGVRAAPKLMPNAKCLVMVRLEK